MILNENDSGVPMGFAFRLVLLEWDVLNENTRDACIAHNRFIYYMCVLGFS